MTRTILTLALALVPTILLGQDAPREGVLKAVNSNSSTVVLTVNGKDLVAHVDGETRIMVNGQQRKANEGLGSDLKPGSAVRFVTRVEGEKNILVGLMLQGTGNPNPQPSGDIERGKVKKLDMEAKTITLDQQGKERELQLTEDTIVFGAQNKEFKQRFANVKAGEEIMFRAVKREGKEIAVGLRPMNAGGNPNPGAGGPLPKIDTTKLVPLPELGKGEYQGQRGGLYPDGANVRPETHEKLGQKLAEEIAPRDRSGKLAADGKIVLLSIGMSNTSQASQGFEKAMRADRAVNPKVQFVNGAVGGMTAAAIQDPNDKRSGTRYWSEVDSRLQAAGVSREQVQVIWIKEADAGPSEGFPTYARKLEGELSRIVQFLPARFPNLKHVYLSSRTYAGFASTRLNPEPYAYESAFSVKWLIEKQLTGDADLNCDPAKGAIKAPWLSWGPYIWANPASKRVDGYSPEANDFALDGTHHASPGVEKLGRVMLDFFRNDTATKAWFVR